MKRKDSNCVGILSDLGEAATASNVSEYTILSTINIVLDCQLIRVRANY